MSAEPISADQPTTEPEAQEPQQAAVNEASTEPAPVQPDEHLSGGSMGRAPSWPFGIYAGLWLAFAAFIVWRFLDVPADTALYELELYRWIVLAGVLLTAWGPLLAVVVWLANLGKPQAQKGDLFASALFKAAVVTFAGVCLWWGSLLLLDQLRIGSLL